LVCSVSVNRFYFLACNLGCRFDGRLNKYSIRGIGFVNDDIGNQVKGIIRCSLSNICTVTFYFLVTFFTKGALRIMWGLGTVRVYFSSLSNLYLLVFGEYVLLIKDAAKQLILFGLIVLKPAYQLIHQGADIL
jgi:hypothetical protein